MPKKEKYLVQMSILDLMAQNNVTVSDISVACGFKSAATFERIIQSEERFPLDKVHQLANSLRCGHKRLWMLALTDWFGEEFAADLENTFECPEISVAELMWINCLREIYPDGVPPINPTLLNRLEKFVCAPT